MGGGGGYFWIFKHFFKLRWLKRKWYYEVFQTSHFLGKKFENIFHFKNKLEKRSKAKVPHVKIHFEIFTNFFQVATWKFFRQIEKSWWLVPEYQNLSCFFLHSKSMTGGGERGIKQNFTIEVHFSLFHYFFQVLTRQFLDQLKTYPNFCFSQWNNTKGGGKGHIENFRSRGS